MRFAVEQSDKYDNAIFVIEGKQKGKYIISLEKLSSLWLIATVISYFLFLSIFIGSYHSTN